jgi:chaperone modulatory protein CbpM
MAKSASQKYKLDEICNAADIPQNTLVEIVTHGIVKPEGESPSDWTFEWHSVTVINKAYRLRRDLDIDWAGIALAMDLLDELESLRAENLMLKQRLQRFLLD